MFFGGDGANTFPGFPAGAAAELGGSARGLAASC